MILNDWFKVCVVAPALASLLQHFTKCYAGVHQMHLTEDISLECSVGSATCLLLSVEWELHISRPAYLSKLLVHISSFILDHTSLLTLNHSSLSPLELTSLKLLT